MSLAASLSAGLVLPCMKLSALIARPWSDCELVPLGVAVRAGGGVAALCGVAVCSGVRAGAELVADGTGERATALSRTTL